MHNKSREVPNFLLEGLTPGIMGTRSHISLSGCSSKHHDKFYDLDFVIHVLLAAILKQVASRGRIKECNQI